MSEHKPSKGMIELIGKALTDEETKVRLFEDPEPLFLEYSTLSDKDVEALTKLDRDLFEDAVNRLGGRTDLTIKVVISKSF